MLDIELGKKVIKALQMLDQHPAVHNGRVSQFSESLYWWMAGTCKNGINRGIEGGEWDTDVTIRFYSNSPEFDKWFEEYADEDLKKLKLEGKLNEASFEYIEVPYEKIYGCKWEPSKITYRGELSYYVCDWLTVKKLSAKQQIFKEHEHYTGLSVDTVDADSFEELILKIAEKVESTFGKVSLYDFYTDKEKQHKEPAFFAIPTKNDNSLLISNLKYKRVTDGELNYRFWVNFYKTEAGKKLLDDYGIDLTIPGLFDFKQGNTLISLARSLFRHSRELFYNIKYRLTGSAGQKFL